MTKFSTREANQSTDLPVKMLNDNSDIFRNYICDILNDWVNKGNFPSILNL